MPPVAVPAPGPFLLTLPGKTGFATKPAGTVKLLLPTPLKIVCALVLYTCGV